MKKSLFILLSLLFVNSAEIKGNYFLKQFVSGVAIGLASGSIYKLCSASGANSKESAAVSAICGGGLIGTKFFYDLLTAQTSGDGFKGVVSTPFYTVVAVFTALVINCNQFK